MKKNNKYKISKFTITEPSIEKIKHYLRNYGPVVAGIKADIKDLFLYDYGIFKSKSCQNIDVTEINHAVTVVGYDVTHKNNFYWIVQNRLFV